MKRTLYFLSLIVAVIAIALLSGCAQLGAVNQKIAQDVESIVAPIRQTTIEDAQAALAIAQAAGDTDAAPCYQDIIDDLSKQGTSVPSINGLLSALEAARTFKAPTVSPKTHKDCAVLVVDAQVVAFKLGIAAVPAVGAVKVQAGAAALKAQAALLTPHP